jgi:hypothetical protein
MQKSLSLAALLFFIHYTISAQSVGWFETVGIKNLSSNFGYSFYLSDLIATDSAIYVGSTVPSTPRFHFYKSNDSVVIPLSSCCRPNGFVAKYSTDGRFQWARLMGSFDYSQNLLIAERDGFVYAASILRESGFIGLDSIKNLFNARILIVKFDKNGREVWRNISSAFNFSVDVKLRKLLIASDDKVYLAGEKNRRVNAVAFNDVIADDKSLQFVFQFDTDGNAQRVSTLAETVPTIWDMRLIDMQPDGKGNFIVLLSPSGRNVSSSCAYTNWQTLLYKLDNAGKWTRLSQFDCTDLIVPSSLGIDENGDMLIAGAYRGTIKVGRWQSKPVSCEVRQYFVLRLTQAGQLIWFRASPRPDDDVSDAYKLLRERDGNWLLTGYATYDLNSATIDHRYPNVSGTYPNGRSRIFIKRLSPAGETLDSVLYYNRGYSESFNNLAIAQNSRQTFLAGQYSCYFDSLAASTCFTNNFIEAYGDKIFIAEVSKNVLTNRQPTVKSTPSVMQLSPNPVEASTLVRFDKPLDADIELTITNISGQVISRERVSKGALYYTLQSAHWASGIYIVNTILNEKAVSYKLIKV